MSETEKSELSIILIQHNWIVTCLFSHHSKGMPVAPDSPLYIQIICNVMEYCNIVTSLSGIESSEAHLLQAMCERSNFCTVVKGCKDAVREYFTTDTPPPLAPMCHLGVGLFVSTIL